MFSSFFILGFTQKFKNSSSPLETKIMKLLTFLQQKQKNFRLILFEAKLMRKTIGAKYSAN